MAFFSLQPAAGVSRSGNRASFSARACWELTSFWSLVGKLFLNWDMAGVQGNNGRAHGTWDCFSSHFPLKPFPPPSFPSLFSCSLLSRSAGLVCPVYCFQARVKQWPPAQCVHSCQVCWCMGTTPSHTVPILSSVYSYVSCTLVFVESLACPLVFTMC